jgi:tripartite-type tricarboxylate transporter receptor subunit TctC
VPTVAESGLPGFEVSNWFGVLAPRGTPAPIVAKLHGEIVRILETPDMRARLVSQGADPIGSTPEQLAKHIQAEMVKWSKVINDANIRLD